MTYKLNPMISKILCPVVLIMPNKTRKEYKDGTAAYNDVFDQLHIIDSLKTACDGIEVELSEQKAFDESWNEKEAISFF